MSRLEEDIAELIRASGPLTGAEIKDHARSESLALWQTCRSSAALELRMLGRQYLRLDRQVEGYARLSPSILREFLTYSVTGLSGDPASLGKRAGEVASRIEEISKAKYDLAYRFVDGIRSQLEGAWPEDRLCFILAGDIVYRMAHDVPRPERSTGTMVRGSDLDLVVIADDAAPEALLQQLDEAIYQQKYRHLINPSAREEIDYIVKRFQRLREQAGFDTFKKMVACKILQEGVLIHGSQALFAAARALLDEHGVSRKLAKMEAAATHLRRQAEEYLLSTEWRILGADELHLFFTTDESEEFE